MGGRYFTLEFTNVSHEACSLFGYPQISAYAASQLAARQPGQLSQPDPSDSLASGASQDSLVRPQRVRLKPGRPRKRC